MNYRHSIRDVMDLAAKKTGIEGWQAYRWSAVEGGDIVRGCVPCGVYSRGPRKGLPKWRPATPGTEREVVVVRSELDAAAETYEREECKCWHCKGEGKTVSRVSVIDGTSYRECCRCSGTGKPHNPMVSRPGTGSA